MTSLTESTREPERYTIYVCADCGQQRATSVTPDPRSRCGNCAAKGWEAIEVIPLTELESTRELPNPEDKERADEAYERLLGGEGSAEAYAAAAKREARDPLEIDEWEEAEDETDVELGPEVPRMREALEAIQGECYLWQQDDSPYADPADLIEYLRREARSALANPEPSNPAPLPEKEQAEDTERNTLTKPPASLEDRCPRDTGWCDGVICRENGIDCPHAFHRKPAPPVPSESERTDHEGEIFNPPEQDASALLRYLGRKEPSEPESASEDTRELLIELAEKWEKRAEKYEFNAKGADAAGEADGAEVNRVMAIEALDCARELRSKLNGEERVGFSASIKWQHVVVDRVSPTDADCDRSRRGC